METAIYLNYEWAASQNLAKYAGKWVAVVDKKIVAAADNIANARKEAFSKFPNAMPFFKKVPISALSIL